MHLVIPSPQLLLGLHPRLAERAETLPRKSCEELRHLASVLALCGQRWARESSWGRARACWRAPEPLHPLPGLASSSRQIHVITLRSLLSYKQNAGEGVGEREPLLHCWWECTLVQPLWKTAWKHLKKSKVELPYDPAIPFLGIYPEKTIFWKKTFCTPMFIAALFIIARKHK